MLKLKQKRHFSYVLIAALLISVGAASLASARNEDLTPSAPPVGIDQASADTPNLIMTLDSNVTEPDSQSDEPNLYQTQDNPTTIEDNSTRVIAQDDSADDAENILIAPQTQNTPDYTVPILGGVGVIAVAAAIAAAILVRRRKID
jgi:CHASE1-domain containing sensor protein